ncbi:MAG: Gfo/Idh/MocA family oxidoreductase [Chloroflexi bacterium]|nr:Gfo/Idh/MocA family oxidoreductase [Chloroflexota bacterium]
MTTLSSPVRFAIVSPSRWGRTLLNAAAASPILKFAGVTSRDFANAHAIVEQYGGCVYASYDDILGDPSTEAVLLPTPNFLHYDQTMAALSAGKHVLVEKPIANTVAQAREMQSEATRRGLVLAVGMQGRRTGAAHMVKQMIDDGTLGRVALAAAMHGAPLLNNRDPDSWYMDADKAPGGPLDQLAVHYFDLLAYFFGPVRRVFGAYTRRAAPATVPDAASAILEMEDGTLVTYSTHQISAYVSQLVLFGTKGALHFKRFGQELLWEEVVPPAQAKVDGPTIRPLEVTGPHPFTTALTDELEDFARCVREGGTPLVGAAEGIAALRVARAVMESWDTGRVVELD